MIIKKFTDYIIENYNKSDFQITKTDKSDFDEIVDVMTVAFETIPRDYHSQYLRSKIDYDLSYKVVYDGKIVGILLLSENDYSKEYKNGIEGVAFAILPEFRGHGVDRLLIKEMTEIILNSNYGHVWCVVSSFLKTHVYWKRIGFTEVPSKNNYYVAVTYLKVL